MQRTCLVWFICTFETLETHAGGKMREGLQEVQMADPLIVPQLITSIPAPLHCATHAARTHADEGKQSKQTIKM